jgi:hypothetical protein
LSGLFGWADFLIERNKPDEPDKQDKPNKPDRQNEPG